MSIPTLQGLQTALSGLLAEQQAIDVTGSNITNANTEGYSRQTAVLQTAEPLHIAALSSVTGEGGQLGTGVTVATYTRIRNTYLDAQYRTQNTSLGAASTQAEELGQAQSVLNEPSSTGLASQLSAFWSSWSELAEYPSSGPARVGVVSAATQLTDTLHQLSSQLQSIEGQAAAQYAAVTGPSGEVSSDAAQLAELNHQIKLSLQAHQQPNSLEDSRDLLLDKLSALASVTVTKEADGTDTVTFGNAALPLVEGSTVNWPQVLTPAAGGSSGRCWNFRAPPARSPLFRPASTKSLRPSPAPSTRSTLPPPSSAAPLPRLSKSRSPPLRSRAPRKVRPAATTLLWTSPAYAAAPPTSATPRSSPRSAPACATPGPTRKPPRPCSPPSPTSARRSPAFRSMKK